MLKWGNDTEQELIPSPRYGQRRSKRIRLDPYLASEIKPESNIPQLFSTFTSFLSLFIPSALWSTRKAVKASEQNCQELCLPGFLTKSFEKPQQDGPQHILWKCCAWLQACWGRMEGFSKCHRDMKCRGNQTHRLRTSSSASCSSLIKSFQAAGDNNTVNRAS